MTGRNLKSGVALLEVMIALLIMAMSALVVASALGTLGRTGSLLTRNDAGLSEAIAMDRLHTLAEAVPSALVPDTGPLFSGTGNEFTFLTVEPGREAHVTVNLVTEGQTLVAKTEFQSLKLSDDATEVVIRYYGKPDRTAPDRWVNAWSANRLPKLVKVSWKTRAGAEQVPIVLAIAGDERRAIRSFDNLATYQ